MQTSSSQPGDNDRCVADMTFGTSLNALRPRLHRYARSLARDADTADDLVQDTMLRAWNARSQFVAETNLKAWTFTILRNLFLSGCRRDRFHGDYDEVAAERIVAVGASQQAAIDLADVETAIDMLPVEQRQALQLVAIAGMTTDEAAERIGALPGTVKSRVSRARSALRQILDGQTIRPVVKTNVLIRNAAQTRPDRRRLKAAGRPLLIG
jgi:RNA polymerase sigma-70 factor (ECF subfamily)